jgi:hypothetical protein
MDKNKKLRFCRYPSSVGRLPLIILSHKRTFSSACSLPNSDGMVPVKELECRDIQVPAVFQAL